MTCLACGAELHQVGVGRPRRFCSTSCRVRAHRDPGVTKLAISRTIVTDLSALAAEGQRFGAILADPPWSFRTYSDKGKGRSAEQHYSTQSLDDIRAMPVAGIAADDCALFLWATMPMLPAALEVIEAWGFTYKTDGFVWVKQNKRGTGLFTGMGYWTRSNAELCLLATRGRPQRRNKDVRQIILSPVQEHSRKPDEVPRRIQRLVAGPYLELYARRPNPGWRVFGNETGAH